MNINNFGYSVAADLGQTLSAPLDRSISNITSSIRDIFSPSPRAILGIIQLIWYGTIGAIICIPATPFWMVGRTISFFSASKVNYRGLHYRPIDVDLNPALGDIKKINLQYLHTCMKNTNQYEVNRIINTVNYGASDEQNKQYATFIRAIVKKMGDSNFTADQKKTIVQRLIDTQNACFPTWVETAGKIYFEIYGGDDVETKILRMVQDYKEALMLHILQVDLDYSQWHTLNYARAALGDDLGLDKSLIQFDNYTNGCGFLSPGTLSYVRDLFLERYGNANRMVEAVHTNLSLLPPREVYNAYSEILKQVAKDNGLRNEQGRNNIDDFVTTQCFSEDYKIKPEAVNMILKKLELIK